MLSGDRYRMSTHRQLQLGSSQEKYYMNRVVQQDHVALMNGKAGSAVLASVGVHDLASLAERHR